MTNGDWKIKIGKYVGKYLKDIPPKYLIDMHDKGHLRFDKVAERWVFINYKELKELANSENK